MKTLMTAAALAALIAATPALAEDAMAPAAPAQDQTQATTPAPAPAAVASTDQQIFVGQQAPDAMLATNWIGKSVYDSAGNNLGDINDLVIDKDGRISAVVLGVGGFLGIGEKAVAVSLSTIQSSTDENGNIKLMANLTKDQLDAAPEFVTLASLRKPEVVPAAPADQVPAPAPAPAQ